MLLWVTTQPFFPDAVPVRYLPWGELDCVEYGQFEEGFCVEGEDDEESQEFCCAKRESETI